MLHSRHKSERFSGKKTDIYIYNHYIYKSNQIFKFCKSHNLPSIIKYLAIYLHGVLARFVYMPLNQSNYMPLTYLYNALTGVAAC